MKKLKFLIMSDLHCEFDSIVEDIIDPSLNFDALIIAGDLTVSRYLSETIKKVSQYIFPKKFFYVSGNHDFYYSDYVAVTDMLYNLDEEIENFTCLNNNVVDCGNNIIIIGATSWQLRSDYTEKNYPNMNDFYKIADHDKTVLKIGNMEKLFLEDSLEENEMKRVIVVTHLPPTVKAIDFSSPESDKSEHYLLAYYNDLDVLITKYSPMFWVCGHIHDTYSTQYHDTKIVRNAYGYEGSKRQNASFLKNLIIEI